MFINNKKDTLVMAIKISTPDNHQYGIIYSKIKEIKSKVKILDIGASQNFINLKKHLPKNFIYHTLDFGPQYDFNFNLDKGKLPIKGDSYDIIICTETLEHVMYPERVVKEMIRVAKKNATFLISLPNEYNFIQRFYFLIGKKSSMDETFQTVEKHLHIHKPRVRDILSLMSRNFKIVDVDYIWQSHLSHFSVLAENLDRIINLFARIWPSVFTRLVLVTAKNK